MPRADRTGGTSRLLSIASLHVTDESTKGVRAAVAAYVVWGLLTIYWKELAAFDAFELIGWRIACAGVVMAIVVTLQSRWPALIAAARDRRTLGRVTVAALLLTANWTSYVWAVVNGRVIEAALGYFMAPLGTMLLGIVVLHEHAGRLQRLALACAAASVVVLTISYGRPPVLAFVIAVSWSLYGLCKRRVALSPAESLAGETFLLTVPAAVLAVVLGFTIDDSIPATASAPEWILVLLTGVVTAVPLLLFAFAAQRVPLTLLGGLQYLVPIINFLLGWLLYDEAMPADRLVGFALIWAALAAVTADRWRAATPRPADVSRLPTTARG
jgi:chloramphenicol-sensitive protein RarD